MLAFLQENISVILSVIGHVLALGFVFALRKRLGLHRWWQPIGVYVLFFAITTGSTTVFVQLEKLLVGTSAAGIFGVFFIAAPILLLLLCWQRRDVAAYFDVFAYTSLVNMFVQRMYCCLIGCCSGFEIFSLGVDWPVREVELICDVVLMIVLLRVGRKQSMSGNLFPLLMICFSGYRFVIEWGRYAKILGFGLHLAHIWAVLGMIIGISIYQELRAQAKLHVNRA